MSRRSPQPGAGKHANSKKADAREGAREHGRGRRRNTSPASFKDADFLSRLLDQSIDRALTKAIDLTPGTPVRLVKESTEKLVDGVLLPGTAAQTYGYVVRELMKQNDEQRRNKTQGARRIVVKLVNGQEAVTDPWNLDRVSQLDLLAACAEDV